MIVISVPLDRVTQIFTRMRPPHPRTLLTFRGLRCAHSATAHFYFKKNQNCKNATAIMSTATKLLGGTESQLLTFSLRSLQTLMEILSLSRRNQNTSSRDLLKCGIWKYIWCLKEKKKRYITGSSSDSRLTSQLLWMYWGQDHKEIFAFLRNTLLRTLEI